MLVAVYEAEKTLRIMPDRGFEGKIESDWWDRLAVSMAKDFSQKRCKGEFFSKIVEQLKVPLADAFPPVDGENELADDLRQ